MNVDADRLSFRLHHCADITQPETGFDLQSQQAGDQREHFSCEEEIHDLS
jgi:hypothetical protein